MLESYFSPSRNRKLQDLWQEYGLGYSCSTCLISVCALGAIFVYRISTSPRTSSRKWWWNRRAAASNEDSFPPTEDLQIETHLTSNGARVTPSMVRARKQPVPLDHWLSLSNLDRVVNPTFSSLILYYTGSEIRGSGDIARILIESLREVLSVFYALAGRLEVREDGLVELHCNNKGAVFLEVNVDKELRSFGSLRPQPALSGLNSNYVIKLVGKNGPPYLPDQLSPMPVLIIQLTRFKCGSISLGVNWHHTVADGSAGCHFIRSWAETAFARSQEKPTRSLSEENQQVLGEYISSKPNHDRSLLSPRDPLDPSLVNRNGYSTKVLTADITSSQEAGQKSAVVRAFSIPEEKVLELVNRVNIEEAMEYPQYAAGRGKGYTKAECLSAEMWRAFTRSRYQNFRLRRDRDLDTRFFMFVDGRGRLNLPKEYFGNVVCSACALTTEEKLLSEPLIYAAYRIRKAVDGVNGPYFRSLIDWVETHGLNGSSKSEHVNSTGQDVAATFWNRFPLYRIDFGWGIPAFAARNSPPRDRIDGFSVMPSSSGEKDMVVLVNLHADRLERLLQEESFSSLVVNERA